MALFTRTFLKQARSAQNLQRISFSHFSSQQHPPLPPLPPLSAFPRPSHGSHGFPLTQIKLFHSSTPRLKKDPYEVLGVPKDSPLADIKKSYYALAKKYHPDSSTGDETKFREVQEAYELLSDEDKRQAYDQFGFANENGGFPGGGAGGFGGSPFGFGFGAGNSQDPFESILRGMGMGGMNNSSRRGTDIQVATIISFEEAAFGVEKELSFMATVHCKPCSGTGAKAGTSKSKCKACNGSGHTYFRDGGFTIQTSCHSCGGSGEVIKTPCPSCSGSGTTREKKTLKVKIPGGIEDGGVLRIYEQGNAGEKNPGHLYVSVRVLSSKIFKRKGNDIYVDVPLSLSQAVLGGSVIVPTLKGEVEVKVPAGTQPGEGQRLRGRGIANSSTGATGHEFITFKVKIPTKLTEKQKKLLEEFAVEEEKPVAESKSDDKNDDDEDEEERRTA